MKIIPKCLKQAAVYLGLPHPDAPSKKPQPYTITFHVVGTHGFYQRPRDCGVWAHTPDQAKERALQAIYDEIPELSASTLTVEILDVCRG